MIYSDQDILEAIEKKEIVITPFSMENLNPNSYDLHLSPHLAVYTKTVLDSKAENLFRRIVMDDGGFMLIPGELYLASTLEHTATLGAVPFLEGKSSVGRLGISVHITAGVGDYGFEGHWTLEMTCIKPIYIYPGMPIAQIMYFDTKSTPIRKYRGNYAGQTVWPEPSKLWKNNFFKKKIK